MAALLFGRGQFGYGRVVVMAPRLPPPPSTEAKLLATISMQKTVCARDLGLPENMPRFLAAVHALRRLRWPIDQYTRGELDLVGLDDWALSGRWGIWPASRLWPRHSYAPNEGERQVLGLPARLTWEANQWPDDPNVMHGVGTRLPGCVNPTIARDYIDTPDFDRWRDQVMVAVMKEASRG